LFQTLIPQLHFGDFFNAIGQQRRFGDVRDMSALALNSGHKSASQQVTRSAKALNRCAIARCGAWLVREHNSQGGDRR
jgi:hypothetical protein